jgi:4-diphosphocytidyl-2-C-methyl-D-erythritol kinase
MIAQHKNIMVTLQAPAKVNLSLHILGKRADGYHEIVTRMQKIDLCDTITIESTEKPGLLFDCDDKTLPAGDTNLAVRAARSFFSAAEVSGRKGVSVRLAKKIPVAAGLGGGSSDAGSVLKGLNHFYKFPLSEDDLLRLAREIGSDVPFFAAESTATMATGRGDCLAAVSDIDEYWYLLVNPGIAVSTKWVFDNYALTSEEKESKLRGSQDGSPRCFSLEDMCNALEPVTVKHYPVVGEIKNSLLEAGADGAMMSGSGPTVFGLFARNKHQKGSLNKLAERFYELYDGRVWLIRAYTGA